MVSVSCKPLAVGSRGKKSFNTRNARDWNVVLAFILHALLDQVHSRLLRIGHVLLWNGHAFVVVGEQSLFPLHLVHYRPPFVSYFWSINISFLAEAFTVSYSNLALSTSVFSGSGLLRLILPKGNVLRINNYILQVNFARDFLFPYRSVVESDLNGVFSFCIPSFESHSLSTVATCRGSRSSFVIVDGDDWSSDGAAVGVAT